MASALDPFERLPVWQRLLVFLAGVVIVALAWFFVFYRDAVEAAEAASTALSRSKAELASIEDKKANFLARQQQQNEVQAEIRKKVEVLPMSTATVENLMQTFQQQARLVGFTIESWAPEPEQREDYYARLPIKVKASGTWAQAGEFFRRVAELGRLVSIEAVQLKLASTRLSASDNAAPRLEVVFQAATYRMLSEAERAQQAEAATRRTPTAAARRRE